MAILSNVEVLNQFRANPANPQWMKDKPDQELLAFLAGGLDSSYAGWTQSFNQTGVSEHDAIVLSVIRELRGSVISGAGTEWLKQLDGLITARELSTRQSLRNDPQIQQEVAFIHSVFAQYPNDQQARAKVVHDANQYVSGFSAAPIALSMQFGNSTYQTPDQILASGNDVSVNNVSNPSNAFVNPTATNLLTTITSSIAMPELPNLPTSIAGLSQGKYLAIGALGLIGLYFAFRNK